MHPRYTSSLSFREVGRREGRATRPPRSPPGGEKAADTFYRRSQLRLARQGRPGSAAGGEGEGNGVEGQGVTRLGRLVKNRPAEQMVAYPPAPAPPPELVHIPPRAVAALADERRLERVGEGKEGEKLREEEGRGDGWRRMGQGEEKVGDRERELSAALREGEGGVAQITQMRNDHQAIGGGLRCRRYSCSGFCGICARRGYIHGAHVYTGAHTDATPYVDVAERHGGLERARGRVELPAARAF